MIRQMVVTARGREHLDGRPAMALVLIGMHDVRLGVVIRSASRICTRCNRENGGSAEHHEKPKTFVLAFETNDELAKTLQSFASEQWLTSASFKAIGALSSVRLGLSGPSNQLTSKRCCIVQLGENAAKNLSLTVATSLERPPLHREVWQKSTFRRRRL
jgi:hypothetical protein